MKNALNRLQGRLRHCWYMAQARTAIARCNRSLARRRRIGVAIAKRRPRAPYFAPGIIDGAPRRGIRPYVLTVALAAASAAVMLARGGLWS